MKIILYSADGSNCSQRVEWALNYKKTPYQRIEVTQDMMHGSYLELSAFGYVPAISIDGYIICESVAIIECLEELMPNPPLLGRSLFERASIREVCEFVNGTIHTPQNRSVLQVIRPDINEQEKRQLRADWISSCLNKLEDRLCLKSAYAVGGSFSAADIFVASIYKKARYQNKIYLPFYERHLDHLRIHEAIESSEPM
ncbi:MULTISPECIES: glutathione S-transferase family protein [Vibrio]|uniref:Glutathione S-transferase family protein n=2 Tax=Vibrio TaxID=662 RepID=A0A7X4LHR5_9VIBR|nr:MULTISPECIES: glutathione S-transferase family protein [Vibrio]MBF9003152.1 glutathione S-transferase N-terminal domain-containing protein [Vibrio nitrifigilis]MZI91876.1 glutathione S-transferase family protein [Vibrio eleionomae]